MDPGFGLCHSHPSVDRVGGVIVDVASLVEHTTVSVVGEFIETGVGHDHHIVAHFSDDFSNRDIEDAVGVDPGGAAGV